MDVDAHQMLQFAGPMHLRMGGLMMMNHACAPESGRNYAFSSGVCRRLAAAASASRKDQ